MTMALRLRVAAQAKLVEAFRTAITSKSDAPSPSFTRLQAYQKEFELDPAYDGGNGDQFAMFDVSTIRIEEHLARVPAIGFDYTILNRNADG